MSYSSSASINSIQGFLMELGYQSAAIWALDSLGGTNYLIKEGESSLMTYAKMGTAWALIDELVMYLETGNAYLLEGQYYMFINDAFFDTLLWASLSQDGIFTKITHPLENSLPFSAEINGSLATGVVKVSAKLIQDYINTNYNGQWPSYFTNISQWLTY